MSGMRCPRPSSCIDQMGEVGKLILVAIHPIACRNRIGRCAANRERLYSGDLNREYSYRGRTAMEVTSEAPLYHSRWGISC
jgi:hypothetical protein